MTNLMDRPNPPESDQPRARGIHAKPGRWHAGRFHEDVLSNAWVWHEQPGTHE